MSSLPDPGPALISRVTSGPDLAAFHASGQASVAELSRTLAIAGASLESCTSILDFGCGCGRMLLWLQDVARHADVHGTDIDAEAIAWCQANLPWATCAVNGAEPPTAYPDASFDLVYNHSVFTHIDERLQDLWLAELQRITRPGGLLVLSVHGETALPAGAWEIRDELERNGIAFLAGSVPSEVGLPEWYQNTWHAPWYLFSHWQRFFRIRAYVPGGALGLQDQLLLERVDGELPRPLGVSASAAASAAGAAERVADAMASLQRYLEPEPPVPGAGLLAQLRGRARTAAMALMRPYSFHQQKFNEAVLRSIQDLARAVDHSD